MDFLGDKEKPNRDGERLPLPNVQTEEGSNEDIEWGAEEKNIVLKIWHDDMKNKFTKKAVFCCLRDDCTYRTLKQGLTMKTARRHLFTKHMLKDDICKTLLQT